MSELYVHPIKSCRGVRLEAAELDARGFVHDRRMMLVDERGAFVTLREEPTLALVDVGLASCGYDVRFPSGARLSIDPEAAAGTRAVRVWDDTLVARVIEHAGEAFSEYLGREVALVAQHEPASRPMPARRTRGPEGVVSLADAYPLLVVGCASVDDLARRADLPLDVRRFRPNIVLEGLAPYEEDAIARARIGAVHVRGPKACVRCVAITVDPETGVGGREPLRTLAGFRRWNGGAWFGMNMIHEEEGELRVGDRVEVLDRHADSPYG